MARNAAVTRKTRETNVAVSLKLDGTGRSSLKTGIAFLDHMLDLFGAHGLFDLSVRARGDLEVDLHHCNEDIGLVLGQALDRALGSREGIERIGFAYVPMEEALARVVVDICGRAKLVVRDQRPEKPWRKAYRSRLSGYRWADAEHFLESLCRACKITLHVDIIAGSDFHHTCEAVFKALGRALNQASRRNPRVKGIPSSKGRL